MRNLKELIKQMTLDKNVITDSDSLTVTVTLKNSGSRAGKETVQLYLKDNVSSAVRPIQELIAFKKVFLKPGESCSVCFEINEPMLRYWNAENQFVSESGEFTLSVGYADHVFQKRDFSLIKN